jgi:CO/xanthine dehydrogenase FAD-binding subunit
MKEFVWYHPKKIEEAAELVQEDGVIPHGGGTWILMRGMKKTRGLIDLDRLPLHFFRVGKSHIEMGSLLTYAEVAQKMYQIDRDHVLVKALSHAASTPLRNRITAGGAVASFPAWSDLMGPLLALDAEVNIIGQKQGRYAVDEYARTPELRKNTLIYSIRIKKTKWDSYYHREVRTRFDYPVFTASILSRKDGKTIEESRVVVVGCIGKFLRLERTQETIHGKKTGDLKLEDLEHALDDLRFARKKGLEPGYTKHLLAVALERGLEEVTGG